MRYLLVIPAILFLGCATATKEGMTTFGVSKAEVCERVVVHPNGDTEKFNCQTLQSEGISGEFAGVVSILFRWWPF